ncbi:MAG: hypothetical protein HQK55_03095 [Deltaproteobacteria bacterium]|nr:hypothetical protein [Deltaproteobacteria bacterium]
MMADMLYQYSWLADIIEPVPYPDKKNKNDLYFFANIDLFEQVNYFTCGKKVI